MRLSSATTAIIAAFVAQASADSIYEIAKSNANFSTLVAAIDAAKLDTVLDGPGNYTVFAPPNSAFEELPSGAVAKLLEPDWFYHLKDLLLYHVLSSPVYSKDLEDGMTTPTLNEEDLLINLEPPRINDVSNIILELVDIQADNGVIHAVEKVLLPTSVTKNIVDIASGSDIFSTLVELVVAADLVGALSGDGPMTVFAPTNEAFAALPAGTVDELKKPENIDTLKNILTYHVLGSNVASADLKDGPVETLQGDTVQIQADPPMVNDANITAADILASNGIIHAVDAVLVPSEGTSAPTSAPSGANARVLSLGVLATGAVSYLFF